MLNPILAFSATRRMRSFRTMLIVIAYVAALLALGTAPFWLWRSLPVTHSPAVFRYFSVMAGVNLFAALWLLMESFCQLREWSLRFRPWLRRMCALPVAALLYMVIVPVVSVFACFGLLALRRILVDVDSAEELKGGMVITSFVSWLLSGDFPLTWILRAMLLIVLPVLLLWEALACVAMMRSRPFEAPAPLPEEEPAETDLEQCAVPHEGRF